MFKKLIIFLIYLPRSRLFFYKPKKSLVIFIGKPNFLFSLFNYSNYPKLTANINNTIAVWREYYNFYVILKCLFKFKFTFLEYCQEYINIVKPKLIISFLDNYDLIYKLKFKNCKKIVIQNSFRYGSNMLSFKSKNIEKDSIDHLFVYNKNIGKLFKENLKTQVHNVGSFLLNSIDISKYKKKKYKYLYISTFRQLNSNEKKISPQTSYKQFQDQEKKLVKTIYDYLSSKNEVLNILGGRNFSYDVEYNYFKEIIKSDVNWNFIKPKDRHYSFPYECVSSSEIILGIDSSLLYESFALGKKTIFFDCRTLDDYLKKNRHFAWPMKMENSGHFWTNELSKTSISNTIDKVEKFNDLEWNDIIQKYKTELIEYDKKNSIFDKEVSIILS